MNAGPAALAWRATFHLVERRQAGGGPKTSARDVTTWIGIVHGERFVLRVSPRLWHAGESFLTSSNHRLRSSHVGRGGHFLDVEVLAGPVEGRPPQDVIAMMRAVEDEEGTRRPVRLRARGDSFRAGHFGLVAPKP